MEAMERVVDRSELLSEEDTPPSSPDLEAIKPLHFDFVKPDAVVNEEKANADEVEDELEFHLFAPAAGKSEGTSQVTKIRLRSPEPTSAELGFVRPSRDDSYYFTGTPNSAEKLNFEAAAISGQDVLTKSHTPWPGMACAWKVLHIPTTKRQSQMLSDSNAMYARLLGATSEQKRKRPGKKARIATRTRLAKAKAKHDEKQAAADAKEAAEREKRTRRNREKKVKKKNREKAKKAASGTATGEEPVPRDVKDGSSSDSEGG